MHWDAPHRRAAGFVIETVRARWTYSILGALTRDARLHPVELHRIIADANERDAPIVGMRNLHYDVIAAKVRQLSDEGLVMRCTPDMPHGARTTYEITRLGAGLVGRLEAGAEERLRFYRQLVRATRIRRGQPLDESISTLRGLREWHAVRLCTGMTLGLLGRRFSFGLMASALEPMGPSALADQINANMDAHGQMAGFRRLSAATCHKVLNSLMEQGAMARMVLPAPGHPPRVLYQPTDMGVALLRSMWPAAQWGVGVDGELFPIVASHWPRNGVRGVHGDCGGEGNSGV
jgi:DNA-binding HxlR family transcriptional regulator